MKKKPSCNRAPMIISSVAYSWMMAVLLLDKTVLSLPSGAPLTVYCSSMLLPSHGGAKAQKSNSYFNAYPQEAAVQQGKSIDIKLYSTSEKLQFKGFLMMAFNSSDRNGSPIGGTFSASKDRESSAIKCQTLNDAITHTSASLKTSLAISWTPPSNYVGSVTFRTTFVQNFTTFWANVESNHLEVIESTTRPSTMAATTTSAMSTVTPAKNISSISVMETVMVFTSLMITTLLASIHFVA